MSYITAFGKRRVYLVNHDPVDSGRLNEMGWALSKFIALQTINEFRDGDHNDSIAGELYISEAFARSHLKSDEYYLELIVPSDSISHIGQDGQVYINKGYAPKILALKTLDQRVFIYDDERGFYNKSKDNITTKERSLYNSNPDRWSLFAAKSHHLPVSKILPLVTMVGPARAA
jgi:hypothetical protein